MDCIDSDDKIVVTGGFNMPSVDWIDDDDSPFLLLPFGIASSNEGLLEALMRAGLYQLNNVSNRYGRMLDLFFFEDYADAFMIESNESLSRVDFIYHP